MNSQIRAHIKGRNFRHAFMMYEKLCESSLPVDESTFLALLKACTELNDIVKGNAIHAQIVERGIFKHHPLLGNTLVNMYAKCGTFSKAQGVFDELPVRDVISWNVLLGGLVKHGCAEEALKYFEHMQMEGLSPDAVTYVSMFKACGSIGAADKGCQLHTEIATKGLLKRNIIVGNALLDMYSKCGLPSKAQEVFDNLDVRDTISWNTLMAGYIDNGQAEKALKCYEKMQLDNISPSSVTFVCGVRACGFARAITNGQEIHAHISRCSLLEKNTVVGNSVVDMYAKWGWVSKAQEVFDKLTTRDVNSWNALISGYAKLEYNEEVLKCFEMMQQHGVVPDAVTYVLSLKSCGSIGDAVKGRELHYDIERRGLSVKNLVIGTALLDMYAKCGRLAHAEEVFHGLPARDLVAWNALIAGYVDYECGKEALTCLEQMHRDKVSPDAVTFACCLRACGISGMPEKGCEIYGEIARKGLPDSDILVGNALVEMYAKCGWVAAAQEVFNKLLAHDAASWTALITGYNDIGSGEEALRCFQQMQLEGIIPDGVAVACTLKACGSIGAVHWGKALHVKLIELGLLESDFVAGSMLVSMYANCGLLREAQVAFDGLQVRDIVSWNSLIAGYSMSELGKETSHCVEEMGIEGIEPDTITHLCTLRVRFDGDEAKRIFNNCIGDLFLSNTLVDIYAKSGHFWKAFELVNTLPARDVITWNALISGFTRHEWNEEALDCLQQMQAEGILPDDVTFISSLKACGNTGATDKGRELHGEIARKGLFDADIIVCNALVDMYAKCGCLAKAEEVFDSLPSHDVTSWNALMSGFTQSGDNRRVFFLFDKMRTEGQEPDAITFVILLHACSQAVLVERGEWLFDSMQKDYSISPSLKHHTCMIGLLVRTGGLHRAAFRIMDLPFHPDFAVLLTVLDACRKLGVMQLGQSHGYAKHPERSKISALLY